MDKYQIALISGILAGMILDVADALSFLIQKAVGLHHILFQDYMVAALLHGKPSQTVFEFICGQFFHLMFTGVIGCFYVVILAFIKEKNSVFKGWLIPGILVWFVTFMIGMLYRIELFVNAEINTVLSDFLTASIFGIAFALIYERLIHRYHVDKTKL